MRKPASNQQSAGSSQARLDRFLVCGLGSLGQHCVLALKEFGVSVIAIEQVQPKNWEIPNLPELLDDLILGDCRQNRVLEQAKIGQCRAALLVTSNEQVNAETALAVRQLNPQTRLVARSAKKNLNQLLREQLGNFIAFDPAQLPSSAFAFAALGTETLGFFNLDGQWLRVIARRMKPGDHWCNIRLLHELNSHARRILTHTRNCAPLPQSFHQWEPDTLVLPGDTLIYIETANQYFFHPQPAVHSRRQRQSAWQQMIRYLNWHNLKQQFCQFWQLSFRQQVRQVALVCSITVLVLLFVGTGLFHGYYPGTTFLSAFYATASLLLGGYADLFGDPQQTAPIPWWLQLFSLGLTVAGTAFVGVLYALLIEALLSSKFQFVLRRPPIPQQDHVVVIGLDKSSQQVAALLQEFKQPLVGVTFNPNFDQTILPQMPLIVGNLTEALARANLSTAKSVVVATDDETLNLEIALMARAANPDAHLVIRTFGQRLSNHLNRLLPKAQVLGTYAVAAEAFAGAAFGENIINLFRFNNQTVLVTEYRIEAEDTLNELLIAEVAYGYGVLPILYQKPSNSPTLMPSDDARLAVGDRLVVLASIDGLRRVEQGRLNLSLKRWRVRVEEALTSEAVFEGANAIARISECSLSTARDLMNYLPQTLPTPLYKHQAQRLVRELSKDLVKARLVPIADSAK